MFRKNRVLSTICILLTGIFTMILSMSADARRDRGAQEQEAWSQVDVMDPGSIADFLDEYPSGEHADDAEMFLSINEAMEALNAGELEPSFVISPKLLGETWQIWSESESEPTSLGYSCERFNGGHSAGYMGYPTLAGRSMELNNGLIVFPMGSIVGFETDGFEVELTSGLYFKTPEDGKMFFVVIEDMGLVHVFGEGWVKCPDADEIFLGND